MKIILASNSPRRREILEKHGFEVEVVPSAPEKMPTEELSAQQTVEYLAYEKGTVAGEQYPDTLVVSADTIVVLDETVMGKPADAEEAYSMLSALSGKIHKVFTSYTMFYQGRHLSNTVCTEVEFYELESDEIKEYIATGDVFDKAGAYGIQSRGAHLVRRINGDYLNVVGFPLGDFCQKLKAFLNG